MTPHEHDHDGHTCGGCCNAEGNSSSSPNCNAQIVETPPRKQLSIGARLAAMAIAAISASGRFAMDIVPHKPVKVVPERPCLNCSKPHATGRSYCSADCCRTYRAKQKAERKAAAKCKR